MKTGEFLTSSKSGDPGSSEKSTSDLVSLQAKFEFYEMSRIEQSKN